MLRTYFTRNCTRTMYQADPAGPYLDDFTHWLEQQGYRHDTIRRRLRGAAQFVAWAHAAGWHVYDLNSTLLAEFHRHLARCGQRIYPSGHPTVRSLGAQHFLTFVQAEGLAAAPAITSMSALPPLLVDCQHWMHIHRGVTAQTLRNYTPIILDLLTALGGQLEPLDVKGIRAFSLDRARRHGKGAAKNVVTATRMFVRFLIALGRCTPGLDDAIPTIAMWRLATLPQYLPAEDVEHLLTACDPSTPLGARDRAMLLLMVRLGLRANDIAGLRLGDINWQESTLVVCGKSRRETRLPLPQEVGDALLHSLTDARPPTPTHTVFLTTLAPWRPISPQVVSQTAARAIQQAAITAPATGARVLRHAAATAMLRQGASRQTIGDILRHTSIATTAHYAKVDFGLLAHVVRPWPEGVPC
jgi:integrase/recombinase XerD